VNGGHTGKGKSNRERKCLDKGFILLELSRCRIKDMSAESESGEYDLKGMLKLYIYGNWKGIPRQESLRRDAG
jgi:hypothetical protein